MTEVGRRKGRVLDYPSPRTGDPRAVVGRHGEAVIASRPQDAWW
jgi:hypothetical protein